MFIFMVCKMFLILLLKILELLQAVCMWGGGRGACFIHWKAAGRHSFLLHVYRFISSISSGLSKVASLRKGIFGELRHILRLTPVFLFLCYRRCIQVVHKLLCYQKKCRVRLHYTWRELWSGNFMFLIPPLFLHLL